MKLLCEREVDAASVVATVRHGRVAPWVVTFVAAAALSTAAWFAPAAWRACVEETWFERLVVGGVATIGALVLVVLASVASTIARAALRPTNWLLKIGRDGVFVQFRSYLNAHFDGDDATVAWIPFEAIERAVPREERVTNARRGDESSTSRWIDLELVGVDTSALASACVRERTREAPERRFGFVTTRTRFRDEPVTVPRPGVVRVQWPGRGGFEVLAPYLRVGDVEHEVLDLAQGPLEQRARALCRRGQVLDAVRLVRDERGIGLADARAWVDRLERDAA